MDLGCGYGPIACTLAARSPGATVWAVDVNRRALDLCRANAAALDLANVRVVAPDEVRADLVVDLLWSNPPIRIGKAALHDLLTTWLGRLSPAGAAVLVVHKHLGADSLQRWLDDAGWATARLGSRQRQPAPRGATAMKQLDGTGMKRLHRGWRHRTAGRLGLILDNVEGPFNVGAIIRTAAALRAEDVWLAGRTPGPQETKVAKTALGTDRYLDLHTAETGSWRSTRPVPPDTASSASSWPTGPSPSTSSTSATPPASSSATRTAAAPPRCSQRATRWPTCRSSGGSGSLNVATAASIACYEVRRRAWVDGAPADGAIQEDEDDDAS